jgi:predicted GNAT family acetyltransferase
MSDSIDRSIREQAEAERADAARVQAFLRARAGVRSGPFSILFSPSDAGLYANYAVPDDDAQPTEAEVAALEAAFQIRDRTPRLEYAPDAAAAVEAALIAAGFLVELRPPLMVCNAAPVRPAPPPEDFDLWFVEDEVDLSQAVRVQAEAYDGDPDDFQWLRDLPGKGGRVAAARHRRSGEMAGVGAFVTPFAGVTEVVGIATRPAFRRRGLAQAMTSMLTEAAFSAGCRMTWLSAAGEAQSNIYARTSYVRRNPMLFISKLNA